MGMCFYEQQDLKFSYTLTGMNKSMFARNSIHFSWMPKIKKKNVMASWFPAKSGYWWISYCAVVSKCHAFLLKLLYMQLGVEWFRHIGKVRYCFKWMISGLASILSYTEKRWTNLETSRVRVVVRMFLYGYHKVKIVFYQNGYLY